MCFWLLTGVVKLVIQLLDLKEASSTFSVKSTICEPLPFKDFKLPQFR